MVPPTLKPTDRAQRSDRRHFDPPGLWVTVSLASVVIHLFAIGMLRLLLNTRLDGLQSGTTLVPIDVIALSSEASSSIQPTQTPGSVATRKPTPLNTPTPKSSNRVANRPISSVSTPSRTNASTAKVPNSQTGGRSPATKPSSNQPPKPAPGSISPKPSPNQPPKPAPGPISPKPSPSQPVNPVPGPTSPNPQPGGGFRATIGPLTLTDPSRDVPTRSAQLRPNNRMQFPPDYLTPLGIKPNQGLVLTAKVLIEPNGKATVLPNSAQVSPGNVNADKAEQLAKEIIESWTFEPAYMGSGPVAQAYNIELDLRSL